jgi:hypothetical protein
MDHLRVSLMVELCLAFGIAGLFWPDKFMSVFDVLMFPWTASYRLVRAHCCAAIGVALVLAILMFSSIR